MIRHSHGIAAAAIAATLALPTAMLVGCGGSGGGTAQTQGGTGSESQEQLFDEFGNKKEDTKDSKKGNNKKNGTTDSQSDQSATGKKDDGKKSGNEADDTNAKNSQLMQDTIGIDARGADEAATIIADLGVGELKSMKVVPGTTKTVTVVDVYGKTYVLEFSPMGSLHVVREEGTDGKIIFGVAS